ncbi:hypothetical protein Q4519_20055 [Motilimonas sp. 1_MG-2023]|uniref:hypothetical protein n=1 Tax=Motilimonas sp. 1_MG-2023 TaxID=3062672 RepID=UPI0026E21C4D|nr:hypothetical protein [Motilimonas sp. 1_MG-2023]MDO6527973.1 hypothetical protein [Motilimonas sp. 1_MG-2023]
MIKDLTTEKASALAAHITKNIFNVNGKVRGGLKENWIGGVANCHFNEYDIFYWLNEAEFSAVILPLAELVGDKKLIIVEDFERGLNGKFWWLGCEIENSWEAFNFFTEETDIMSFYMIGESEQWCLWAGDDSWIFCAESYLFKQLNAEILSLKAMLDKCTEKTRKEYVDLIHAISRLPKSDYYD